MKISKRKLIKILSEQEKKQHQPTYISPEETSQEDWLKGYNRWKKRNGSQKK